MSGFTGNKDADREILKRIKSDRKLLLACSTDKYFYDLCNDAFFYNRISFKYPGALNFRPIKLNWKKYYLYLIFYIDKLDREYNFYYSKGDPKQYYDILSSGRYLEAAIEQATRLNLNDLVYHYFRQDIFDLNFDGALVEAVKNNNKDLIELFINNGANDFEQALAAAVETENKELINYFITKDPNFTTALRVAAEKGNVELIKYFVEREADINYGLCGASRRGDTELIEYFIDLGANNWEFATTCANTKKIAEYFIALARRDGLDVNNIVRNAFNSASSRGNLELIKYFRSLGADNLNTALNNVILNVNDLSLRHDLVEYLIGEGANNWALFLNSARYKRDQKLIEKFTQKIVSLNI